MKMRIQTGCVDCTKKTGGAATNDDQTASCPLVEQPRRGGSFDTRHFLWLRISFLQFHEHDRSHHFNSVAKVPDADIFILGVLVVIGIGDRYDQDFRL